MATPITDYRDFVRLLLQDNDPDLPIFDSFQIDNAVRLKVGTGKVPGYTIVPTQEAWDYEVEPELTMDSDPKSYALLVHHAAHCFVVGITSAAFNTRAFSQRTGKPQELVDEIKNEIYSLEFGEQAA